VSHDDQRSIELFHHSSHKFEKLRLRGDIHRRGWLIGDNQFGVAGKGYGNHNPLPHTPAELMGEAIDAIAGIRNTHQLKEFYGSFSGGLLGHFKVYLQHLIDLIADRQHWIQLGYRLLKYQRYSIAADSTHFIAARLQLKQVLTLEKRHTIDDLTRRTGDQLSHGELGHGFTAAALADQTDYFTLINVVGHTVNRLYDAAVRVEVRLEISYL